MPVTDHVKSLYVSMCRFEMRMNSSVRTPMLALKLCLSCCWYSVLHSCTCRPGLHCSAVLVLKLYAYRLSIFSAATAAAIPKLRSITQPCSRIVRAQYQRLQH